MDVALMGDQVPARAMTSAWTCHEAEVVPALRGLSGVLPHALDPDAARRLWDVSEQLLSQARVGATG